MRRRAVLVCGLCGALSGGCTTSTSGSPDGSTGTTTASDAGSPDAPVGTSTGPDAGSLAGTWTLTLVGNAGVLTTVTIGQDALDVTSSDFTLTATRTGNVLAFTDNQAPGVTGGDVGVLTATQTAGAFHAGILPFDLGGSWTMQAGPKGGSATLTCTLTVTATEIDGSCQNVLAGGPAPWFTFTTKKTSPAASSLGDFGGTWTNSWTWAGTGGGTFPCTLDFAGNSITTCDGGATDYNGSPVAGITFTYDGANTVSGAAYGWAEFSATR